MAFEVNIIVELKLGIATKAKLTNVYIPLTAMTLFTPEIITLISGDIKIPSLYESVETT